MARPITAMNSSDTSTGSICPCKNCVPPKRHVVPTSCHDTCEEYHKWKRMVAKINDEIKTTKTNQYLGLIKKKGRR